MYYWLDTEFIDDGKTVDLISIGIVSSDDREYYAQSCEFDPKNASQWVTENIIPHLQECPYGIDGRRLGLYQHKQGQCVDQLYGWQHRCPWRTRKQLVYDIKMFFHPSDSIELWGWCSGFDFVALCQLFGTMENWPSGYPHYIKDFQYMLDERGISDTELPEQEEGLHNALADAKHLKKLWGYIMRNDCWQ